MRPNSRSWPECRPTSGIEGYLSIDGELNTGRISKTEGYRRILREFGVEPRPDLVRALVARDRELLLATVRLYDDAIPLLESLRSRGVKIAIVSNCTEHTRRLLTELGVAALADSLVLSCEVGAAKPEPEIFRYALDQLGVAADAAVFVDDQPDYCAGAVALGITDGADHPGRAGREGACRRNHGGSVPAGSRGHVLSMSPASARR